MRQQMVKMYLLKPTMSTHECCLELFMDTTQDMVTGGALTPYGEALLKDMESNGIIIDNREYTFADKEAYLRNLHKFFDSPYLSATEYIKQESELPELQTVQQ
jgi:hypothetical protein